ncbi:MAG: helix-turn-helix transcriptional regulator [Ruminococcaceae bacterium]|nr:helix-turn-helix transcriptional regulator [Oscillospiraceae bacterium]
MSNISVEKEMKTFLCNLAWLKKHYNLSDEEIAEKLGINVEIWQEVESRKIPTNLTVDIFYKIKDNFNISPADMIYKDFTE